MGEASHFDSVFVFNDLTRGTIGDLAAGGKPPGVDHLLFIRYNHARLSPT